MSHCNVYLTMAFFCPQFGSEHAGWLMTVYTEKQKHTQNNHHKREKIRRRKYGFQQNQFGICGAKQLNAVIVSYSIAYLKKLVMIGDQLVDLGDTMRVYLK